VWRNPQQHPQCDIATTTLHSPFLILNWSHTFSAKERDSETGLSYFGARYYSSDLSIWLSVDPMSDKYPSLSPYVYCADNPVRLVDPNGCELWKPDEEGNLVAQQDDDYKCTHAAVYYGTDSNGTVYIYSKNGRFTKPVVMPLNEFINRYGSDYGQVSGYYN
jgi:RHS repeat-associated protein